MNQKIEYSLKKFQDALGKLVNGIEEANDELEKDGVIQRFEFTFEMLWKTLKIYLEYEGILCKTPRSCLKEAFRIDLINNEHVFLDMLEDRNLTAHIYDKETSEKIFFRIKANYLPCMKDLFNRLIKKQ